MPKTKCVPYLACSTVVVSLASLTGCASERSLTPYEPEQYQQFEAGSTSIGDRVVSEATLFGDLAGDTFAGDARVRSAAYNGTLQLELALPTEQGAVMHLLEVDESTFEELEPGETLSYGERDAAPAVWTLACAGPEMDLWEVDVPVERFDLAASQGPSEDSVRYDWTVLTRKDRPPYRTEESSGSLVLAPAVE